MADWVRQSVVSSSTPVGLGRTAWLAPYSVRVDAAIEAYFASKPRGEDVTLAVLEAIGQVDLDRLRGGRTFRRAKQDLGLFVAQRLCARFGAVNVSTWRRGRDASTRAATGPTKGWVGSYTPHKVG